MSIVSHSKWRISASMLLTLSLVFALLFLFLSHIHAFASPSLLQLSSDPYTNSRNEHQTEVSPDSASHGSNMVSAFQAGHGNHNGGSSNIGWATTSDNGASWTNGFLPHTTKQVQGTYDRVENPAVAYDASHTTWMITMNAFISNNSVAVLVSLSTNGGTTWSDPVTVLKNTSEDLDKTGIACDNTTTSAYYGHCYIEWHDERQANLVQMSTSTDGGLTWGTPLSTADHFAGINGHPLVQPNGKVIVPINTPITAPKPSSTIVAFTSTDGGASWSSTVTVTTTHSHTLGGSLRSVHFPTAKMDHAGNVYIVWEDCRFETGCTANDLVMTTSTDGVIWTPVTRIPVDAIGSGVDHYMPGFAVDRSTSDSTAHLALTYYYLPVAACDTTTCQLMVGFVSSNDGGTTWSTSTRLAGPMTVTWLTTTVWGYMVGDYITTSFVSGKAFPVFDVASASTTMLHQNMYTVAGGITV